jgi:hypothetical protein
MFHYELPGHPDHARAASNDPADEGRCAACGRVTTPNERIVIAGVPVHLRCALRRRAGRA